MEIGNRKRYISTRYEVTKFCLHALSHTGSAHSRRRTQTKIEETAAALKVSYLVADARSGSTEVGVDFRDRAAEDERADGVARHLDVGKGAEDVHAALGEDDTRLRRILDGVLALAVLTSDAAIARER